MNTDDRGKEITNSVLVTHDTCPKCKSKEMEMRNCSAIWHEGDIHCVRCGAFVRTCEVY